MKLHFTLLIVIFSSLSLFAQTQKGDLFFGQSNSQINHISSDETNFSINPTFGTFITNKIMIGSSLGFNFGRNSPSPKIGLFINKYFGKKEKIQGLAGFKISRQGDFDRGGDYDSSIQVGAAWFPSSNSSLNLTYNVNLHDGYWGFLPNGLNPDIGLSMYFFLRKNQEEAEKPNARQSTNAGTKKGGLSGNLFTPQKVFILRLNGNGRYFLKDNLYLQTSLQYSFVFNNALQPDYHIIKPQIGAGYYLSFSEQVALKFDALFSLSLNEQRSNNFYNYNNNGINTKGALLSTGFALFLGRHRIEPTIGIDLFHVSANNNNAPTINNSSVQVKIEYEYFLSQNVSVSGLISVLQKNKKYFLFSNSLIVAEQAYAYRFEEYIDDRYTLDIGFNYYLTR